MLAECSLEHSSFGQIVQHFPVLCRIRRQGFLVVKRGQEARKGHGNTERSQPAGQLHPGPTRVRTTHLT